MLTLMHQYNLNKTKNFIEKGKKRRYTCNCFRLAKIIKTGRKEGFSFSFSLFWFIL